ncbi:hypothetical protein G6O69_26590 [Pseudenhygromyxa sp. WMMC2535]|uniref:hypothetical protein n=1 Tax=Pseudenhygromyxa sp. WMMC2535 TaxID=2712867 RepID=UPI0015554020|nr:hypothetical protein [Pseudenhygromyxa sp. WMMC2535]NVB41435.1 hypothetical protein [Pseudenhygromyxa sp. WMMC2535]
MFAALIDGLLGAADQTIGRGAIVLIFAGIFVLIVAAALSLERPRVQAALARVPQYRRLQLLGPGELRYRGMVSLGLGLCSLAAMLTVELLLADTPVHAWLSPWGSISLGLIAVVATTIGAAFLERAAHLDGLR